VQPDGATLRSHLQAARRAGVEDERLNGPPLPRALFGLWSAFIKLSDSRHPDSGIAPTEIEAYGRLQNQRFTPWEVDTLLDVDHAWRRGCQLKGSN
jgi:hypothetical protein